MEELQKVLRCFSESRARHSDISRAIDEVFDNTKLDKERVVGILEVTGVYVLPGSEMEDSIKSYISSVDRSKITAEELARQIGFRFVISNKESKRLVELFAGG
jgi:hypothetical protein